MPEISSNPLNYYARPGLITDPKEFASLLDGLPTDIPSLVKVVQGLMLHIFWGERYGVQLSEARRQEVQLRWLPKMLKRLVELDDRPLTEARPPDKKLVGNCRDHSVLMTAMLQHQGVPARARCGFGAYFRPNHFEDHWVCEYWKADEQRWVMVDAQLDQFQCDVLKPSFDTLDVPHDQFITGGLAWQLCRSGRADPECFGIFDMHGLPFVLGDLLRDFLARNQLEILPWDGWGLMVNLDQAIPAESLPLLDRMAALTLADNTAFAEVRALYENDLRLRGSVRP